MMMKKYKNLFIISLFLLGTMLFLTTRNEPVQETITFFPIDPTTFFQKAETNLSQVDPIKQDSYSFQWRTRSTLDKKSYLRQDVGLLYSNGRLIGKMGEWKENNRQLEQEKKINGKDSALLQALTFHYAELHRNEAEYFSAQKLSNTELYVVRTPFEPFFSFREARTSEEEKWKRILDDKTVQTLQDSWKKGIKTFSIPLSHYFAYPLTTFYKNQQPLPGYTKEQTERIVGTLWEGLYKNYFLGIKQSDGTTVSPFGSIIPLILLAKNRGELLVISETAKGEPILLRQKIEYER